MNKTKMQNMSKTEELKKKINKTIDYARWQTIWSPMIGAIVMTSLILWTSLFDKGLEWKIPLIVGINVLLAPTVPWSLKSKIRLKVDGFFEKNLNDEDLLNHREEFYSYIQKIQNDRKIYWGSFPLAGLFVWKRLKIA